MKSKVHILVLSRYNSYISLYFLRIPLTNLLKLTAGPTKCLDVPNYSALASTKIRKVIPESRGECISKLLDSGLCAKPFFVLQGFSLFLVLCFCKSASVPINYRKLNLFPIRMLSEREY